MSDFNLGNIIFCSEVFSDEVNEDMTLAELEEFAVRRGLKCKKNAKIRYKSKYVDYLNENRRSARIAFGMCDDFCAGPYTQETVAFRMLFDSRFVDAFHDERDSMLTSWMNAIYSNIYLLHGNKSKAEVVDDTRWALDARNYYQDHLVSRVAMVEVDSCDPIIVEAARNNAISKIQGRIGENMRNMRNVFPEQASIAQVASLGKLFIDLTLRLLGRLDKEWSNVQGKIVQAFKMLEEKKFFILICEMCKGKYTAQQLSEIMRLDDTGAWRGLKVFGMSMPESNQTLLLSKLDGKKRKREC